MTESLPSTVTLADWLYFTINSLRRYLTSSSLIYSLSHLPTSSHTLYFIHPHRQGCSAASVDVVARLHVHHSHSFRQRANQWVVRGCTEFPTSSHSSIIEYIRYSSCTYFCSSTAHHISKNGVSRTLICTHAYLLEPTNDITVFQKSEKMWNWKILFFLTVCNLVKVKHA